MLDDGDDDDDEYDCEQEYEYDDQNMLGVTNHSATVQLSVGGMHEKTSKHRQFLNDSSLRLPTSEAIELFSGGA